MPKYVLSAPLLLIIAVMARAAEPEQSFRWDWSRIGTIWVTTVIDSEQHLTILKKNSEGVSVPDRKMTLRFIQTVVTQYSYEGKDEEKNDTIVQTVERAEVESADGDEQSDKRLINFKLTLHVKPGTSPVKPEDELVKIDGRERLIEKLLGDDVRDVNKRKTLEKLLTEQSLRNAYQQLVSFRPDKPVMLQATWQRPLVRDLGSLGKVEGRYSYKFAGSEKIDDRDLQLIEITSKLDKHVPFVPGKGEATLFQVGASNLTGGFVEPLTDVPKLTGEEPFLPKLGESLDAVGESIVPFASRGVIYFDAKRARLHRMTQEIKTSGELTLKNSDQEREVKIDQTQKINVVVTDSRPVKKKKKKKEDAEDPAIP